MPTPSCANSAPSETASSCKTASSSEETVSASPVNPAAAENVLALPPPPDLGQALLQLLASPSIANKRWIYRQYDSTVRTNTLVGPGSDAAVVRIKGTRKAVAVTTDCNARFVYLDPRAGAAMAVAEAARNLAVSGARPLALTDCLNFGSPERPEILWQFKEAVEGIAEACRALDIPVVGGNVSFYNETLGQAILPTPVIGMAGLIDEAESDFHISEHVFRMMSVGAKAYLAISL